MGKYIFQQGVNFDGMNKSFLEKNVLPFLAACPDTIIYSCYRSPEKQAQMRLEYEKKLADYNSGKTSVKPSAVNRPYFSAHNYGIAIDVHPVSLSDTDYAKMQALAVNYGLKRDSIERWHFQDKTFTFEKAKEFLAENKTVISIVPILILATIAFILKQKGII